jgi:lipopolysaccharide/colanic/teichoic acid biosynthesis glycosyltransferase
MGGRQRVKRGFDMVIASAALLVLSPLLAALALVIWIEDRRSPWFRGVRVGRNGREFRMLKFRSMRVGASQSGVNSTAADDARITRTGRWLRRAKLDELPQLWNVVTGDMSLAGPRPQVLVDAALYTREEQRMLTVQPGITDLASIVFADEGEILNHTSDPDLLYNQIIRPWKSRLALLYVDHASFGTDLRLIWLTALSLVSRRRALKGVRRILETWGADPLVQEMARRDRPLSAYPPPGAKEIVTRYRVRGA